MCSSGRFSSLLQLAEAFSDDLNVLEIGAGRFPFVERFLVPPHGLVPVTEIVEQFCYVVRRERVIDEEVP